MLVCDFMNEQTEENEPVRHRQPIEIMKINLKLSVSIFVIERVNVVTQTRELRYDCFKQLKTVQGGANVITGFCQIVTSTDRTVF